MILTARKLANFHNLTTKYTIKQKQNMKSIKKDRYVILFSMILYFHKNKIHKCNTAQSNLKILKSLYSLTLLPFLECPEFGKCTEVVSGGM